ncbi:hypothetical protein [Kribbella deserti]|uniref:Uncharacterized protein n=1 Tax=Kribbella deserti TaxID=1926257 RepID=A0ABV6QGC8_9ACTN
MTEQQERSIDFKAQVTVLANAYRVTLLAGDRELGKEKAILRAMVAASAADVAEWVRLRLPDGASAAEPLDELVPDLQRGDHVGKGITVAKKTLLGEAKDIVVAAVTGGTMPLWLTSVLAFLLGLFAFSETAGQSLAAAVIPLIAVGGGATMAFLRVVQATPAAVSSIGDAAGSLWDSVDRIGAGAERVFVQHSAPALSALYGLAELTPGRTPVLAELRGSAKTIVGLAYTVLALCLLFFGAGIVNAFNDYFVQSQCLGGACPPR